MIGVTENYLEIPTTFKHGTLEIKLHGKVELELGVKTYTTWKYVEPRSLCFVSSPFLQVEVYSILEGVARCSLRSRWLAR